MHVEPGIELKLGEVELFALTPDHVSDRYVYWLNDPAVNRYLESRFVTHTVASTRAFVQSVLDSEHSVMFGIRSVPDAMHVGNIKLGPIERMHRRGEIGLLIGEAGARGRGIGTAAIELVTRYGFTQLGLKKLSAGCYGDNRGSIRAFEKAGYVIEATRCRHYMLDGRDQDAVLMARWAD